MNQLPEYVTVKQFAQRRNITRQQTYDLIYDQIIQRDSIAGKELINWDIYGTIEITGSAVFKERKISRLHNEVITDLNNEVKRINQTVQVLSDKVDKLLSQKQVH